VAISDIRCAIITYGKRSYLEIEAIKIARPERKNKRVPPRAGSLHAEEGSGGLHAYARNRLTQIQSWFRQKPVWNFFMLDRLHKSTLFFRHKKRGKACPCV